MKTKKFYNYVLRISLIIAAGAFLFAGGASAEQNSWYWYMNNGLPGNEIAPQESAKDKDSQPTIVSGHMSGQTQLQNDTEKPQYVPNEIIVKFKDTSQASFGELNRKHKVKKIDPIFKNFKKDKEKIEALKLKNELKTKYRLESIPITAKEAHLIKRLARAPKDAIIPDLDGIYKLELEAGQSVEEAVAEYSKDPNVEYVQPNYINVLYATPLPQEPYIPNDYYIKGAPGYWREDSWGNDYPDLWGHQKIQAIEAYNVFDTNGNGRFDYGETKPGEGIIVAVIDTGVDYNHEDLAANIWINQDEIPANGIDDDNNGLIDDVRGWDFSNVDADPSDYYGHGTHCAGTIAAIGNNNTGVIGVAPAAKVMPVKIFPNAYTDVCADAIKYAADNGAEVLSNSWGPIGRRPSDPVVEDAIDYAYSLGCVVVFAAGNTDPAGDDVSYYSPQNYSKVITVAATDSNDEKASFSNWGEKIDVAAPGVDVLSLRAAGTDMYGDGNHFVPSGDPNAKYYRSDGTSMACPHAAGVLALILSRHPDFFSEELRHILRSTADDIGEPGPDIFFGAGRINASNAANFNEMDLMARISSPRSGGYNVLKGTVAIKGYAYGSEFSKYELYYGEGRNPTQWYLIATSDQPVRNNTLCTWPTEQLKDGYYVLKLIVYGTGLPGKICEDRAECYIDNISIPFEQGWPVVLSGVGFVNQLTCDDIDGDGKDEIIAYGIDETDQESKVYVFYADGTLCRGWPVTLSGYVWPYYENYSVTVADLYEDQPGKELIVTTLRNGDPGDFTKIYIYNKTGTLITQSPDLKGHARSGPVVADLDNDGYQEIIGVTRNYIFCLDRYAQCKWTTTEYTPSLGLEQTSLAVGDVNGDNEKEIVVGFSAQTMSGLIASGGVRIFNARGIEYVHPHSSIGPGGYLSSPVLADLDNDGKEEIIAIRDYSGDVYHPPYRPEAWIDVWKGNGSPMSGWPQELNPASTQDDYLEGERSSPAVGDIDGDGDLEILIGWTDAKVYAYHHNGVPVSGWPFVLDRSERLLKGSPAIGDILGDEKAEIVFGVTRQAGYPYSAVYILSDTGDVASCGPLLTEANSYTTPILKDVDGDGVIELIISNEAYTINAYTFEKYSTDAKWPMFQHNPQHTGCYPSQLSIINVPQDYPTIGEAIEAYQEGIIRVSAGVYVEDVSVQGKDISLIGEDTSDTIINGNIALSDSDSSLKYLTILYQEKDPILYSNEYYTDFEIPNDSGITAINSDITVKDCIIMPDPSVYNDDKFGKAIQVWNLNENPDITPFIQNNLIINADKGIYLNSEALGGAILGDIKNNTFDKNNHAILMESLSENPLIDRNILTRSTDAIHLDHSQKLIQATLPDGNVIDYTYLGSSTDIKTKRITSPGGAVTYFLENFYDTENTLIRQEEHVYTTATDESPITVNANDFVPAPDSYTWHHPEGVPDALFNVSARSITYSVDINLGGDYNLELWAKNYAPGLVNDSEWKLVDDYTHFIVDVTVDGNPAGTLYIPASDYDYQSAAMTLAAGLTPESHSIRLTWINDAFDPDAQQDCNIQIQKFTLSKTGNSTTETVTIYYYEEGVMTRIVINYYDEEGNLIRTVEIPVGDEPMITMNACDRLDQSWEFDPDENELTAMYTSGSSQYLSFNINISGGNYTITLWGKNNGDAPGQGDSPSQNRSGWTLVDGYTEFLVDVLIDENSVGTLHIPAVNYTEPYQSGTLTLTGLSPGTHSIKVVWLNDAYSPEKQQDCNIQIQKFTLEGGISGPQPETFPVGTVKVYNSLLPDRIANITNNCFGTPRINGDFNLDGVVDAIDLDIIRANWHSTNATYSQGDANGDHKVDLLDMRIVSANWCRTYTEYYNFHNLWCDDLEAEQLTLPDAQGNIAEDPEYYDPDNLDYTPQNPNCDDKGARVE